MDRKIIDIIRNEIFEDFTELKNAKIYYDNASKHYLKYLELMNTIAKELKVKPDQLEMFLFMFGNHLKN